MARLYRNPAQPNPVADRLRDLWRAELAACTTREQLVRISRAIKLLPPHISQRFDAPGEPAPAPAPDCGAGIARILAFPTREPRPARRKKAPKRHSGTDERSRPSAPATPRRGIYGRSSAVARRARAQ